MGMKKDRSRTQSVDAYLREKGVYRECANLGLKVLGGVRRMIDFAEGALVAAGVREKGEPPPPPPDMGESPPPPPPPTEENESQP